MNSTKIGAIVTGGLTLIYVAVLGQFGVAMIMSKTPVGVAMGLLVLTFPLLGVWALVREFKFGVQAEKLSERVKTDGAWPEFDLEMRPSGRAVRSSADKVFEQFKARAEAAPDDWHSWFNLSLAYDAAGDRRRARTAMQRAIKLASE